MTYKLITGNDAIALGALRAGVSVVTGYPGTPSTGALTSLLESEHPGTYVEWSTNEKVALEVAVGTAWAGKRALCTMKMSGVNVAYDSLISIAYSGVVGALVIYVADDPGTSAGMCEQDSRGFALMSDLPMLEPASVAEAYQLMPAAFDLSEETGTPVFVRLVTAIANAYAQVDILEPIAMPERQARLINNIDLYTKAGAVVCMAQHRSLIARLAKAGEIVAQMRLNRLELANAPGGLGIIACGVTASYLGEAYQVASRYGFQRELISELKVVTSCPFPAAEVRAMLAHCSTLLVLEELEPYVEQNVYVEAARAGFAGKIIGKLDGTFSRVGEYGIPQVMRGLALGLNLDLPEDLYRGRSEAEAIAAARPITVCAGCPHRGTYMAINAAIRKLRYKPADIMVTGDIGCTILGMNPPFFTVWNEISMGASISLAQGYVHSGITKPVIATIGDSTFFHGGIPGLINAIQHRVPLTLVIMDNGWTAMTGMQVNPGTDCRFQPSAGEQVDIARLVPALGVEQFFVMDPYDLEASTETMRHAMTLPGVKVVLSRRECIIAAGRRGERAGLALVQADKCNLCRLCVTVTGCAAITLGAQAIEIDPTLCFGCGLCAAVCNRDAISMQQPQVVAGGGI